MFSFLRRRKKEEQRPKQQSEPVKGQSADTLVETEQTEQAHQVAPSESAEQPEAPKEAKGPDSSGHLGQAEGATPTETSEQPQALAPSAPQQQADVSETPELQKQADLSEPSALQNQADASEASTSQKPAEAPEPAAIPEAAAIPEPIEDSAKEKPSKRSWFGRLRAGLARTGQNLSSLFVGVPVDENLFEELETALIMADSGMEATEKLLQQLRARVRKERLSDAQQVKQALQEILADHLRPLEKAFPLQAHKPLVVMIAGVNGAGKTTSIGKLAHAFQAAGASVLLAAGDTFRAAAREQLVEWGERNNVTVIAQSGGDPAAVAFDAVHAAQARDIDVVMVDTAGRLPTQLHLMEELKKVHRVTNKALEGAPHEVLLVVDGNTGQNALAQIRAFDAAINLTGLVVTKLDGTAKGGILAAVAAGSQQVRPVPVYWIGVGEGLYDLQPFDAQEFSAALLGNDR